MVLTPDDTMKVFGAVRRIEIEVAKLKKEVEDDCNKIQADLDAIKKEIQD